MQLVTHSSLGCMILLANEPVCVKKKTFIYELNLQIISSAHSQLWMMLVLLYYVLPTFFYTRLVVQQVDLLEKN